MVGSKHIPLKLGADGPIIGRASLDENGLFMGEIEVDQKYQAELYGDVEGLSIYVGAPEPEDVSSSNLVEHAKRELEISGVDEDIYGDLTSKAVMELIEVFARQGHSGMSASLVSHLFKELAAYKNLTPLTDNPDEWYFHEAGGRTSEDLWQNKRNGAAFSKDGGKTYYFTDEIKWQGLVNLTPFYDSVKV